MSLNFEDFAHTLYDLLVFTVDVSVLQIWVLSSVFSNILKGN
jgi:hypothetical protein